MIENENIVKAINKLITKYTDILEEHGDPNEHYKYLAINTFLTNWDIEAADFYKMFKVSFSKQKNLLYQNSIGFMNKAVENFPEETREMFRNLYDEEQPLEKRVEKFKQQCEELLPKVKEKLGTDKLQAQQDERTISVYLGFRFPEKYIFYKSDYYDEFCEKLQIQKKNTGEKFFHFQKLADEIIDKGFLQDQEFLETYRSIYPNPTWDDQLLMLQNILFVTNRKDLKEFDILNKFKQFNKTDLINYYQFLDKIIEKFDLKKNDSRLVFNARKRHIVMTIGQRYAFCVQNNRSKELKFQVISDCVFAKEDSSFDGEPVAYWNTTNNFVEIINNKSSVFNAIEKELNRTQSSSFLQHNKKDLERMAFDKVYRNEILNQLEDNNGNNGEIENTKSKMKKIPLNQILFGAPGTGKTYHTKKIAVEIINGWKERTREEINQEYDDLVNAKQIVFTTFHQSLSYEDFIEGIKPSVFEDNSENKNVIYEITDGIFKKLCNKACTPPTTLQNQTEVYDFDNAWNDLMEEINNSMLNEQILELTVLTPNKGFLITEITNQGNLKLKPKSSDLALEYTVSYNSTKKLQEFFPNLSLVKNIDKEFRSVIGGSNSTAYWSVLNYINNKISSNSKNNTADITLPLKNHVLIIDEINRGNVSAIFGELITLLEEDKRHGNKEQTEVILPYSNYKFSVPNNVYVVGTMNTADRSVEALDTALRRRFSFIEMQTDPQLLSQSVYKDIDLEKLLTVINERIEFLIDKDHQIGHSYFMGMENLNDLKVTFKDKIIPLLEEYFYGDFGKIGLVLGGNFVTQQLNGATFPKNFTFENDFLEDKKIYRFSNSDSWTKEAFISIYED